MNILFLDQFGSLGGGQLCLRDLIPGIVAKRWTAHVGLPPGGPLRQEIAHRGGIVHNIDLERYTNGNKTVGDMMRFVCEAPRLATRISGLVRQHRIDLVYVNGPRLLPAAAIASNRLVFHAHSLLAAPHARLTAGFCLRQGGATMIASSHFVAAPLRSHVPPERLQIIYNGVEDYGRESRRKHSAKNSRIGIIGRIAPEKGHLDFVRSARLLSAEMPECRFVICGDPQHSSGSYFAEVQKEAAGLPFEFLQWQENIGAVLHELDMIALPSMEVDATPRVILEAFSAGVPVIAYRSGGISELMEHETNGIFTQDATPQSLASALKNLLHDTPQRERLTYNARRCYLSRFTLERFRREVVGVLERI